MCSCVIFLTLPAVFSLTSSAISGLSIVDRSLKTMAIDHLMSMSSSQNKRNSFFFILRQLRVMSLPCVCHSANDMRFYPVPHHSGQASLLPCIWWKTQLFGETNMRTMVFELAEVGTAIIELRVPDQKMSKGPTRIIFVRLVPRELYNPGRNITSTYRP